MDKEGERKDGNIFLYTFAFSPLKSVKLFKLLES